MVYKFLCFAKVLIYGIIKRITKRRMAVDVTGTLLTPGWSGKRCKGNGEHKNLFGKYIECCCDECDYMMCCDESFDMEECEFCNDRECPNAKTCR